MIITSLYTWGLYVVCGLILCGASSPLDITECALGEHGTQAIRVWAAKCAHLYTRTDWNEFDGNIAHRRVTSCLRQVRTLDEVAACLQWRWPSPCNIPLRLLPCYAQPNEMAATMSAA